MASNAPPPAPPPPLPRHPYSIYLETAIRNCIPKELIPETWKCDKTDLKSNISALLEGDGKLKFEIFESIDKLCDNVIRYMDFPKNYAEGEKNRNIRVERFPDIPKTTSGSWCMYKNDLYKIFDYHKISPIQSEASNLVNAVLEECWVTMKVTKHHEMFVCRHKPTPPTFNLSQLNDYDYGIPLVVLEDPKIKWEDWKLETRNPITTLAIERIKYYSKNWKPEDKKEAARVILFIELVLDKARKFAEKSFIYLPENNLVDPPNKPIDVLRFFSFDNNQFAMADDFSKILVKNTMVDPTHQKLARTVLGLPPLSTVSSKEVNDIIKKIYGKKLGNLEFANMKIDKLMFTQTPIPHEEGYCILAVDVLYEILMDMIVAKKLFHRYISLRDWNTIKDFFESIHSYFDSSREIYFIDSGEVKTIKQKWEDAYNKLQKETPSNPFELNSNTFKERDLIKYLELLRVNDIFEKIEKYAGPVYSKLEKKLPCYLHIAVARCLINGLARYFSWIFTFIREQKACDRLNIVESELIGVCEMYVLTMKFGDMDSGEKKKEGKGNGSKGKKNQGKKKNMKS